MENLQNDQAYIAGLVARARAAQKVAEGYSQRRVDELAAALIYTLSRPELAKSIAEQALEETHMGRVDSKISKLTGKMPAVLYDILTTKTVGVIARIPEKGITKIAKPMGVIAALIPSTNPEATPVFKGVLGLRARNAVIFAPHPSSKATTNRVSDIMREVLRKNGAPEDLFICIEKPSKNKAAELMRQCDITMATGSGDMVKAAYSSGKPAYGVGAGNAVVVIDETAQLKETAAKIALSKTGDWASGCSAENSIVVQSGIYDEFIADLKAEGGYMTTAEEKSKLQNAMWIDGRLNREIVARPAPVIAEAAGITVPDGSRFIMVEENGAGEDYMFSHEKLSVVLTVYKYDDFDQAIDLVNNIQKYSGLGHSCGIHSYNQEHIDRLALNTYTTKVIVRQPHSTSNSGAWHNGLANTFSLGCGTWGGNIASENITQKHYFNITWVSEPIDRKPASDAEIYGDLLDHVVL
ncbi:MAG: aldehyde dehydrogenase family protein [Oscillospiraceae bacterium]